MAHATIRATILPDIIKLICEKFDYTEKQALDEFFSSYTGANFSDDKTGLYGQSPLFIYGLFLEEKGVSFSD